MSLTGFLSRSVPLFALFLLAGGAPLAGQEDPLDAPLPFDPQVTVGTLDNGLRYFIRPNARPEKRAELRLVVNAGSVLEDDDQRGLAHFVEHMAFNGTEHFEKQELVSYLESIGMQFGPSINAFTSFDETVYILRVPTDDADILATAFQILEDWAHGLAFDPEEIDKERGVIVEEWRLGRGAQARMRDKQFPILFEGSKYAERLPIGSVNVLQSFEPETLRRFYRDWYRPDLTAVVAVGDFRVSDIEELIRAHFEGLGAPEAERPREEVAVPIDHPLRFAVATDAEATNTQVGVIYKRPLGEKGTLRAFRRSLLESLHDGMLNRRLFEITQQAEPPFLFAGSGSGSFVRPVDSFQLFALVQEGGIERGLQALLTEAERVRRFGFTASELEREKREVLRGFERAYAERDKQESARFANEYVGAFLDGSTVPAIDWQLEMARELVPRIELEELEGLVARWMREEGRVVLVNAPEPEGGAVITEEALAGVFAAVVSADIEVYADEALDVPLVDREPSPSPVISELTIDEIGVTLWELANGVRVLLKPTDFKDDQVVMRAYSPGGTSLAEDEEYLSASLADQAVARGGVGALSLVDLEKQLAGKAVSVSPFIGDYIEGLAGEASPEDLETLFQLAYLRVAQPRKDSTAFLAYRGQLRGLLQNRDADPRAAFQDTLAVTLGQGHPRALPLTAQRLEGVELDEAYDFYRDRFGDAGDFSFVFVGAFDLDAIRPLVETYLGGLPSHGRLESWRDMGIDPPPGLVRKSVRKGIEPQSRTALVFAGPASFSPQEEMRLQSLASALEIRLRERLREDLGGTYGVAVAASLRGDPDPEFQVQIGFGSDPERVEELVGTVFRELEAMRTEGPTAEEVQKVREAQRRSKETNLMDNRYWAGRLVAYDQFDLDLRDIASYDLIEGWTAEDIRDVAARRLSPENYVWVSLYPEAGGR